MKIQKVLSVFSIFALVLTFTQLSSFGVSLNESSFVWTSSNQYDFGSIEQNIPAEHSFHFVNNSEEPLIIENVKASCGCTVPAWSKEPIMPGETGFVKAIYNAKKAGKFSKTMTVISTNGEKQLLTIKGLVE